MIVSQISSCHSTLKELDASDNLLTFCPALPEGLITQNIYDYILTSLPHIPSSLLNLKVNTKYINCLPNVVDQLVVKTYLSHGKNGESITRLKLCGTDRYASKADNSYVKAPDKPLTKVYFFNSSWFSDDDNGVEDEGEQPVNEFYRSKAGLTAVIYLPKDMHPEKYYDEVQFTYKFEVYGDVHGTDGETHLGTYTVTAKPRQKKIWKFLPLGDLDGQKFTVRVYEGDYFATLLVEGKVNRTQTR